MAGRILVRSAVAAMGTRFEVAIWSQDRRRAELAGRAALAEVERLDRQLSVYRADSDVSAINARAASQPVQADPRVINLLLRCIQLSAVTAGRFNVCVGPLLDVWGITARAGTVPADADIDRARASSDMRGLDVDAHAFSVRFLSPGMRIDLGAVGKGYAIDAAATILEGDFGATSFLIHGGTSSVLARGAPPGEPGWPIALLNAAPASGANLGKLYLRDEALGVSSPSTWQFARGDTSYGHVLDPASGKPTSGAALAAVVAGSATDADAVSTALLVGGPGCESEASSWPVKGWMVAGSAPGGLTITSRNLQLDAV